MTTQTQRYPATRAKGLCPLVSFSSCLFILFSFTGCGGPPMMRTRQDLVRNLGNKVAVEGVYEMGQNGEHLRRGDIDVQLDVPPDLLGFGQVGPSEGSPIRAVGVVARGAMSLGVFIDEQTLSRQRGNSANPLAPGFVLRQAQVEILHPAVPKAPDPEGGK